MEPTQQQFRLDIQSALFFYRNLLQCSTTSLHGIWDLRIARKADSYGIQKRKHLFSFSILNGTNSTKVRKETGGNVQSSQSYGLTKTTKKQVSPTFGLLRGRVRAGV